MSPDAEGVCWHCGRKLAAIDYAREGECPACRRQTHVCRNCKFFRPGLANACREPVAEAVTDKQRANFCGYFKPSSTAHQPAADPQVLRAAADDLFDL